MPTQCEGKWMVGDKEVIAGYVGTEEIYPCVEVSPPPPNLNEEFSGWVGLGQGSSKIQGTWSDGISKFYHFTIPNVLPHNQQQFYADWICNNPTLTFPSDAGTHVGTTQSSGAKPQDQRIWEALNGEIPLSHLFAEANPDATYINPKGLKPRYIVRISGFQAEPTATLVFYIYDKNAVETDFVIPSDIVSYGGYFVYAFWEGDGQTAFDVSYEQVEAQKVVFTLTSNTDRYLTIFPSVGPTRSYKVLPPKEQTTFDWTGMDPGTWKVKFEGYYQYNPETGDGGILTHIWEEDVVVNG